MNDLAKNVILWIVIAVVLLSVFNSFGTGSQRATTVPYSDFLRYVEDGDVDEVVFDNETKSIAWRRNSDQFVTYNPETDYTALIGLLQEHNVQRIEAKAPKQQSFLLQLFISSFPILLLIAVWVYFMRQIQGAGGGRGAMTARRTKATSATARSPSAMVMGLASSFHQRDMAVVDVHEQRSGKADDEVDEHGDGHDLDRLPCLVKHRAGENLHQVRVADCHGQ